MNDSSGLEWVRVKSLSASDFTLFIDLVVYVYIEVGRLVVVVEVEVIGE